MGKFLYILLTVCVVILVIISIEISFNNSKIIYGMVFSITVGYLIYILLKKYIIVKKYYSLQIFKKFVYDDTVKDHFEKLNKKRTDKNKKFQIGFNIVVSYLLTNILFYILEWGKYWFERDTFFYVKKIAVIIGFYFLFHFFYKVLKKHLKVDNQSSINNAYSKVIEEYLKHPFYLNKAIELIEKSPLPSFQIEDYYLEMIRYYAVKKKNI